MRSLDEANQLAEQHLHLARYRANLWRVRLACSDFDEIFSEAQLGLIKASRTFDETRGKAFPNWAFMRMDAEIIDMLRDRYKYRNVFKLKFDQMPEDADEKFVYPGDSPFVAFAKEEERYLAHDLVERSERKLSPRLSRILSLYRQGVTFAQIAKQERVSAGRISQLFDQIERKIRQIAA